MPPSSDQVVQVTDNEGNVVHEEATDSVGLDRAIESAKGMVPAGGKWEVVDLQAAMERRKQRFEADDDVVVRDMEVDPNAPITTVETTDTEDVSDFTDTEFDAEEILNKVYKPRNPKAPVEETAAAREGWLLGTAPWIALALSGCYSCSAGFDLRQGEEDTRCSPRQSPATLRCSLIC